MRGFCESFFGPGQELTVRTGITHVLNLAQEARTRRSSGPLSLAWRQVNIKEDVSKPLGAKV